MRNALLLIGIGATIILIGGYYASQHTPSSPDIRNTGTMNASIMKGTLTLESPAFAHEEMMPAKYTCDGKDISPALSWSGVPEGTQSLVLIMDDPDAPGRTWDHWVVFNIPVSRSDVEEGSEPEGVPGKNSWGRGGYGGPCPPSGTHRYFFRLYALDSMLGLPEGTSKVDVLAAMEGHVLGEVELIGKYKKQ